jgi:uncharacterized protein
LKRGIPNRESCLRLLGRVNLDKKVIDHSIAVCRTSVDIATRMRKNGVNIDIGLVEAGALLHDIGRAKVHGIAHGRAGAKMLRELGYPEPLARIAETHVLCGVLSYQTDKESSDQNQNRSLMTIEEKVVCYADKITLENRKTTLRERYDRWFKKYGRNSTLTRAFNRSKEIESELNSLTSQERP